MLNFKLRKGEIATLLTLGLVLVGTLITLGTSLLVNKTKIASNPKAASYKLCCKTYACGAYGAGEGNMKVTAVGFEGINSSGTVGYTSCNNTGYSNTTYCSSISGAPDSNGGSAFVKCDGSGPVGNPLDPVTAECPTKDYNCNKIDAKIYKDHVLSIDKGGSYHDGDSCKGTGMPKAIIKTDVCVNYKVTTNECFPWDCYSIDPSWKKQKLLAMGDGVARTYYTYTDEESDCNSTAYTADTIVNICNPAAAPTCESTTCGDIVNNVDPSSANKKIYYMSDDGKYYKKIKSGKCETEISDINTECPIAPSPTPTPYKVIYDSVDEIWNNEDYISCNKDGIKSNSLLRDSFIKDCYEGKKEVPNFEGCSYTVMKSDAGWDVVDHLYCCRIKC